MPNIDLNDTTNCPRGHRCESCGVEAPDLAAATAATALGVLCLTLCARCASSTATPPVSVSTAARLHPERYQGWTVDTFGATLKARGVITKQLNRTGPDGVRRNLWGVELDQLGNATGSARSSE